MGGGVALTATSAVLPASTDATAAPRRLAAPLWVGALGHENVHLAFFNALAACGGGTILAVVIGLAFSWIVVRTNTPFKGFIAGASLIPLFVPPLVAGVAWGIL